MSQRGLILALQRFHDDPGFMDRVNSDPQSTLGLYDLDAEERDTLMQAAMNKDEAALQGLARNAGMEWTSDHLTGVGAFNDDEISTEGGAKTGIHGPNAMTGDGYEGTMPHLPT